MIKTVITQLAIVAFSVFPTSEGQNATTEAH